MPSGPSTYYSGGGVVPFYPGARRHAVRLPASVTYAKGTVLGEVVGVNAVDTVTLGTQSSGTFTLTYGGQTTSAIAYNATGATVQTALLALSNLGANGVQTLTVTGTPTGGTFTLSYGQQTTSAIAYNATAATIQAALQALPAIGSGNIACSGGPLPGTAVTITWQGIFAGTPMPTPLGVNATFSGGSLPAATVVVADPGGAGGNNVAVTGPAGGPYVVTFQNELASAPETLTGTFTALTTPGNASIAATTTGVVGTLGTFKAYNVANTDGSQTPKAILEYDCATDANGNASFGNAAGGAWGESWPSVPAFFQGFFSAADLTGLDQNALTNTGWRQINGTVAAGVIELP